MEYYYNPINHFVSIYVKYIYLYVFVLIRLYMLFWNLFACICLFTVVIVAPLLSPQARATIALL